MQDLVVDASLQAMAAQACVPTPGPADSLPAEGVRESEAPAESTESSRPESAGPAAQAVSAEATAGNTNFVSAAAVRASASGNLRLPSGSSRGVIGTPVQQTPSGKKTDTVLDFSAVEMSERIWNKPPAVRMCFACVHHENMR